MFKLKIKERIRYQHENLIVRTTGNNPTYFKIGGLCKGAREKLFYVYFSAGVSKHSEGKLKSFTMAVEQFENTLSKGNYVVVDIDNKDLPKLLKEHKSEE